MDTPLRSKLLTVVLLRRAGGSLLRNPCPPSGPLEGWAHKRSEVGGMERSGRSPEGEQPSVRRKSGHTLSGRAAVRLAEEWTYVQRKSSRPTGGRVTDSAGKAVGWPGADQGADQSADQGADQGEDQSADQGADQRHRPRRRPGYGPGCEPGCGPAVRAENENRAALLVRPALIFGWLHLSQQMCVLKVVISSPHRTLHTSHI